VNPPRNALAVLTLRWRSMPRLSPAGAEQGQQNDGEGVEQQQPVTPVRVIDAESAHAHAETKMLRLAKSWFDGAALA